MKKAKKKHTYNNALYIGFILYITHIFSIKIFPPLLKDVVDIGPIIAASNPWVRKDERTWEISDLAPDTEY